GRTRLRALRLVPRPPPRSASPLRPPPAGRARAPPRRGTSPRESRGAGLRAATGALPLRHLLPVRLARQVDPGPALRRAGRRPLPRGARARSGSLTIDRDDQWTL